MLKDLFVFVKYPAVAGIVGTLWIGTTLFIVLDDTLPAAAMLMATMLVTLVIAFIGFRVDKT